MSKLDALPVDHEYAPGAEPTLMERLDAWLMAALGNETGLTILALLVMVILSRRVFARFTEVRVARAEARRRLEAEENAVATELAKLRRARDAKAAQGRAG